MAVYHFESNCDMARRNKIKLNKPFHSMWKYRGSFIDFSKYLRKSSLQNSGPNKIIVGICWSLVILALIIAFLKIVFRAF